MVIAFLILPPLVSAVVCALIPERRAAWLPRISGLLLLTAAVASVVALIQYWNELVILDAEWFTIISSGPGPGDPVVGRTALVQLVFTAPTLLMAATVNVVSFCIHLFSGAYMADSRRRPFYYAALGFFTFSMLGIALAGNLLLLFVFWELVGFASCLLIGFWRDREAPAAAATKAFIMNRVGDSAFLVGIILLWTNAKTPALIGVPSAEPTTPFIAALLLCGIVAKSAQFPLFTWLPDAMEAPTPVSALIHAATMVAAGVFVLIRIFGLLPAELLVYIAAIGFVTSLIGSAGALLHRDVKRILAYSTISQLGLMVFAAGAGAPWAALLQLIAHAYFKALLFLGTATLAFKGHDHAGEYSYDIDKLSAMPGKGLSVTLAFALGVASLIGVPLTAGFLSKETILETIDSSLYKSCLIFLTIATAAYATRLVTKLFFGVHSKVSKSTSATPIPMGIAMWILMLGCTWMIVSLNPFNMSGWVINRLAPETTQHLGMWTIVSLLLVVITAVTSFVMVRKNPVWSSGVADRNFGFDRFYASVFKKPVQALAHAAQWVDRNIIDGALHQIVYIKVTGALFTSWIDRNIVDGAATLVSRASLTGGTMLRTLASGKIQLYIVWAMTALVIFIVWLLF